MKGLQEFIHEHKKGCLIFGGVFLAILIVFFTIYFVVPSFGNNNYGDRLDGIEKHKVSSTTISDIKSDIKEFDGVTSVSYHIEGRILNFTIETDGTVSYDDSKGYAKPILDKLSKKNQSYYDVQVFLTSKEDVDGLPNAGYKSKNSSDFSWGNVGESSE